MARKRIEEVENISIDDTIEDIPLKEIPKKVSNEVSDTNRKEIVRTLDEEPVSCLRNEKVIIRFMPKPTALVHDPKHILYGGMAENATRSFVVPRMNSTGVFVNVLTNNEKAFLEKAMGLEYNALSIYKKENNFWDDSNPMGIGRVTLHKHDNYLDLSIPIDYIKYKVLLANKEEIAPSMEDYTERPKASYQFVILSENAESQSNMTRTNVLMKCYMEYGKIENDFDTLRVLIELLEKRPLSPRVKLDFLQGKIADYIGHNPRVFLATITDKYLPTKVLIKKCTEKGLIGKKNNAYYLKEDGSPLCEMGEESTLNNAAKYISSLKHQDLKFMLEAKVKEN